ncbi:MAG: metal-dependent transcriptional regulator [Clostridia bacterium]|nr:metal-dependent transcriptional regulator [Clostridia bacterium]
MEGIREISISSTLREYLKVIYDISKTGTGARTTDIAKKLGISKPSVNRAVGTLKAKGYVTHEPYGAVLLTDKGREFGEYSGSRNQMVKRFLVNVLKMNDVDAEREAVQIAGCISYVTAEKMQSYMEA